MFLIMCVSAVKEGASWKLTVTEKNRKMTFWCSSCYKILAFFFKLICVLETVKMKH